MGAVKFNQSRWSERLAEVLVASISEFHSKHGVRDIVALDLGCYPWHGTLELSALTKAEMEKDAELADPAESAAWKFYKFSDLLDAWKDAAQLGAEMKAVYEEQEDDGDESIISFVKACAQAMAQTRVLKSIDKLNPDEKVVITVLHPDSGEQFF